MSSYPEPYRGLPAQILQQEKEVSMQGWMKKKSGREKLNFCASNYEKRFFVLLKGWFYYYKDSTSEKPQKQFSLQGYCNRISLADEERCPSLPYVFKVFPKRKDGRTWYFATDSEMAMNQWREAFRKEINKYSDKESDLHASCSLPSNFRPKNFQTIVPSTSPELQMCNLPIKSTNTSRSGSATSSLPEDCDFCNESAYETYDFQPENNPGIQCRRLELHYVTPTSPRPLLPTSPSHDNSNHQGVAAASPQFPFLQTTVASIPIVTNGPPVPDRESVDDRRRPVYQAIDPEPTAENILIVGQLFKGFTPHMSPPSPTANKPLTKVNNPPFHPPLLVDNKCDDSYEEMNFSKFHTATSFPSRFPQPVQNNNKNVKEGKVVSTESLETKKNKKNAGTYYSTVCEDLPLISYENTRRNKDEDYDDTINPDSKTTISKQLLNRQDHSKKDSLDKTGSVLPTKSELNKLCSKPNVSNQAASAPSLPKPTFKNVPKLPSPTQNKRITTNKRFSQAQDVNNNKCKDNKATLEQENFPKPALKPTSLFLPSGQDGRDHQPKTKSKPNTSPQGRTPTKTEPKPVLEASPSFGLKEKSKQVKKNEANSLKKTDSISLAANDSSDKVEHFKGEAPKKQDSKTTSPNSVLDRAKRFVGNNLKSPEPLASPCNNVQGKAKIFAGNTTNDKSNFASKTANKSNNFAGRDFPDMFVKPSTIAKPKIANKPYVR